MIEMAEINGSFSYFLSGRLTPLFIQTLAHWSMFTHFCGLTLIPAWISNYIRFKVWGEITYPFPHFNGATVEVMEWISNFIPHISAHVITYPFWY